MICRGERTNHSRWLIDGKNVIVTHGTTWIRPRIGHSFSRLIHSNISFVVHRFEMLSLEREKKGRGQIDYPVITLANGRVIVGKLVRKSVAFGRAFTMSKYPSNTNPTGQRSFSKSYWFGRRHMLYSVG